jgi:hypothetical protein
MLLEDYGLIRDSDLTLIVAAREISEGDVDAEPVAR